MYDVKESVPVGGKEKSGCLKCLVLSAVTAIDAAPQVITRGGASPLTFECHTAFTDLGATANDICPGAGSVTISGTGGARKQSNLQNYYEIHPFC
jgi:hypothetical protein